MESHELTTYEAEATDQANRWIAEARRIVVDDADTAQAAADWLTEDLIPRRKAVEEFFAPLVSAAHAAHKVLTSKRSDILSRFDEPERIVKAKLAEWKAADDAARAQAEQAAGPARLLAIVEPERIEGVAFTTTLKAEVVDLAALVKAAAEQPHLLPLVMPNQKAISQLVKALGRAMSVPGIQIIEEQGVRRTG